MLIFSRTMAAKYDVYIENECADDLVLMKFPAMKSQFNSTQADSIRLSIKPKTMKVKLETSLTYTSSNTPIEDRQLFACKIVNNKLICRPVSSMLLLRPDFSHLDIKEDDPEIRPVSVKFAGPERQPPKVEDNTPVEEYKPIKYVRGDAQFGHLVAIKPDPEPVDIKPQNLDPKPEPNVFELVKDCLKKVKIIGLDELNCFIGCDNREKLVLDALSEVALLVQGNWAIKSEILYGDSSERESTEVTGIPINLFIAARDYLLWLFTQDRLVSRLEYSKKVRIPDYDILELFNQFAVFRKDIRRWELKLPTDNKFTEQFPEIAQRQATFWKVRKANKLGMFGS